MTVEELMETIADLIDQYGEQAKTFELFDERGRPLATPHIDVDHRTDKEFLRVLPE